ncbi:cation:proton antiporter [Pontibacillus marinus]|uniref:Sodium:proton antiporter n=1 Tax=Pontibacillus marinus BH030004 = DSM 16465 TaxID=1385511 RepID=A0A0A5G3G4_9BACI|nr:sodium:proton antiporter [Pontibacillus marinus]KGX85620.1 sodium:proton antiporter [Pontibacillus marinus BH030004 = DSM 16465]
MALEQIILLLFIGYFIFTIDKKQKNFPVPMVLLLLGIGLSFIPFFSDITISHTLIYEIFLPALLFISAYQFPFSNLKEHLGIIVTLSTVGLLLTAMLLGGSIYFISDPFLSISFISALLIASLLTPTDPVSVVSILKKSANNPKIADVVEGESMVNDGTSIVFFTVLTGIYIGEHSFSFTTFVVDFLKVSLGGVAIGILFGWLVSRAVHLTSHRQYQVMLSIVLAYGSFMIAEHLGVSGVLASVGAGIMLSWEFDHTIKESHYREYLDSFWEVIEPTILSLIFLLIGIHTTNYLNPSAWIFILIIFVLSIFIRFIVLYGIISVFPQWKNEYNLKEISLITWSGIRGTMTVALLLSFETEASGDGQTIITLTFGVVLLSLILQSITIYPLSNLLQRKKNR